jgi:hypothetical protein
VPAVYCQIFDPTAVDKTTRLLQTDWLTFANKYSITFTNPPGGLDVNALMQGALPVMGDATYAGFWLPQKGTVTVENQTFTGYIVAIAPDYSSYQIIRIIGLDATAQAWTVPAGGYQAKIDSTGALWLKNYNSAGTLFVSAGSVVKQLPIFPPVPLPGVDDIDAVLRQMRAGQ